MLGGRRKRVESVEIVPDLVRERDPGPGGFGLRLPTRDVGHTPVCVPLHAAVEEQSVVRILGRVAQDLKKNQTAAEV